MTTTKLNDQSFVQAMRDNISKSLETYLKDEYRSKKAELIAEMDRKFYTEVASIALSMTQLCDFNMMQDRLIITVRKLESNENGMEKEVQVQESGK